MNPERVLNPALSSSELCTRLVQKNYKKIPFYGIIESLKKQAIQAKKKGLYIFIKLHLFITINSKIHGINAKIMSYILF